MDIRSVSIAVAMLLLAPLHATALVDGPIRIYSCKPGECSSGGGGGPYTEPVGYKYHECSGYAPITEDCQIISQNFMHPYTSRPFYINSAWSKAFTGSIRIIGAYEAAEPGVIIAYNHAWMECDVSKGSLNNCHGSNGYGVCSPNKSGSCGKMRIRVSVFVAPLCSETGNVICRTEVEGEWAGCAKLYNLRAIETSELKNVEDDEMCWGDSPLYEKSPVMTLKPIGVDMGE